MDHFILPSGIDHYIKIPYKCTIKYIPGDFLTFPERHGWKDNHIPEDDAFGGREPSEVEAFFQTWLYFGMLLEVLHVAGVEADTYDFVSRDDVHGTAFITTKSLSSLIRRWQRKYRVSSECHCWLFVTGEYQPTEKFLKLSGCKKKPCWRKLVTMTDIEGLHTIVAVLQKVHWFIERYCGIRENTKIIPAAKSWPVDDTVALSIAALGFTFSEAIEDIYRVRGGSKLSWNVDTLLKDRLRRANWCPSLIDTTVTDFSIDGLYYLGANPQRDTEDHAQCTELRCVSKGLNRDVYRTRHVTDDCQCEHHEPSMDRMLDIISNGGTPLVVWTETDGKPLHLQEYKSTPGHVPSVEIGADGMPVIPERVPIYVAISHVWADGLGNEHQNSLPACQLSRIQRLVDEVYGFGPNGKPGHAPFWMDTLCVPVRKAHDVFRKKCIVAMRNIYQQAAAVLVLDAGIQKIPVSAPLADQSMALYESGWVRRLWTFQEGFLARQLLFCVQDASIHVETMEQQISDYTKNLRRHGHYTPFVDIARGNVTSYYTLLKGAVARSFASKNDARIRRVLCAATILGMDPTPFLDPERPIDDLPQKVSLADLRMETFLRYMGRFPAGIIFNRLPRLQRDGYRWAPKSLMAGRVVDMMRGMDVVHDYNGIGRMCRIDGSSVALAVEYPGFKLHSSSFAWVEGSRMVLSSSPGSQKSLYQVELLPEGDGDFGRWNEGLQYYLVVTKFSTKEADVWGPAILGSRRPDDGLKLRHECCARIKLIPAALEDNLLVVPGEKLQEDTLWFVQ
ncbi:hypothetical protein TCE0_013f01183 [Talaromyces pinophilus]|uniref:Heterokaryon incompatibility domain-containing protein n=1 Tax=Talaromyces pinophilus TaxID=128442 RepID=A0A698XLS7_TALPI|nr:hypothetical protein TCE0_013f01183 [Talaromyces pinophilus]